MARLVPSLLSALTLFACSTDAPVEVLQLTGRDAQVAVAVEGHIPSHRYMLRATLRPAPGASAAATVAITNDIADRVGSIAGGWLEDLDGDGDEDVVVMQIRKGYELRTLHVWMREPAALRRVELAPIPAALRPEGALRETVQVMDGRLVRRLRSVDSGAVTPLAYDFAAETWIPFDAR